MNRLRVDEVAGILPELDELRPVLDLLFARAVPDPERTWSGSGELDTVGDRLVDVDALDAEADEVAARVHEHLVSLYRMVADAVRAMRDGDNERAASLLVEIAELEENAARPDRAEAYAMAAYDRAKDLRDQGAAALALRRAGRAALALGRFPVAAERYERGFDLARGGGDAVGAVVSATGRGNVELYRGRWSEAKRWYREAMELLDDQGASTERWQLYQNLSVVDRRLGDLESSEAWLDKAEDVASRTGDRAADADISNGRGLLAMARENLEAAEEAFREGLDAADRPMGVVTLAVNLGDCLLRQGRVLEAGEIARHAEEQAIRNAVTMRLPTVYRLLGDVASRRGHQDAFVFFERALELVRDRDLPALERAETLEAYGAWEAEQEQVDSAIEHLKEARETYRSLGMEHEAEDLTSKLHKLTSEQSDAT